MGIYFSAEKNMKAAVSISGEVPEGYM